MRFFRFFAIVVCFASDLRLFAHHSFAAEFDVNRPVELNGVVAEVEWTNPHVMIRLDVAGARWIIEAASPNALLRRGFGKSSVQKGSKVEIDAYRAKSGANRAAGREIVLENGAKFLLGSYYADSTISGQP